MFDAYHNVLPYDLQQLFVKYIPLYSARRTHHFTRENVRINMRAMSIPVIGLKLWNSLNESLVSIMTKYIFKRHYINRQIYHVNIYDYNDKHICCVYVFMCCVTASL